MLLNFASKDKSILYIRILSFAGEFLWKRFLRARKKYVGFWNNFSYPYKL